jgi:hypothetical protein
MGHSYHTIYSDTHTLHLYWKYIMMLQLLTAGFVCKIRNYFDNVVWDLFPSSS